MPAGQRDELKLALVMNGGVSLAVWMGGVSNEIFRVVTERHPVYAMLAELTGTTTTVDVISGTSAGGVNGAALAVALIYGGDFSRLREVWLDTGSLGDLLRPVLGKNPGSLLQGEEYFLPALQRALAGLAPAESPVLAPERMPIDLKLTTTLLTGQQGRNVDDFGVPIHDVDYRAYFHFRHRPGGHDFDSRDDVVAKLARAARSTASFPFAFEPSLVSEHDGGSHLRDWSGGELKTPRYVVDGGILDNKPFRGARDAIFRMPRRGAVRRVLAYINPDPGDGPPGTPGGPMPPLGAVLSESLLGIPQSQTVADQLAAIDDHNEEIRARRDSVLTIVASFDGATLTGLARSLYPVYRKRRLASTFQLFVYEPLFDAADRRPALRPGLLAVGKRGREQLQKAFADVPWSGWIPPADWVMGSRPAVPEDWTWGLYPVEFAAGLMLDMLRMAQGLLDYADPPPPAAQAAPQPPVAEPTGDWSDGQDTNSATGTMASVIGWARSLAGPRAKATAEVGWARDFDRQKASDAAAATPRQQALSRFWMRAYAVVEDVGKVREKEVAVWQRHTETLLAALCEETDPASPSGDFVRELTDVHYPAMFGFLVAPDRRARCYRQATDIARLLREAAPLARAIADEAVASGRLRAHDAELAGKLQALAARVAAGGSEADTLDVLLQIEVVEYAFNEHDSLRNDVVIDLMQISGNAGSPLAIDRSAKAKLLGLQLGHFGAFYKRSWRANDWIYGRLDGSERMVRLLLDPERLYRLFYQRRAVAAERIRHIAVDSVPSLVLQAEMNKVWRDLAPLIDEELRFLDGKDQRLPDALPSCAAAVTARLHYGILRDELPVLLEAIHADHAAGAEPTGAGKAFVDDMAMPSSSAPGGATRPFSPEQAARRLDSGLIARERLLAEAGSDLFTRTLAHTAATMQATLASEGARLGPVSLFFASLKLPVIGFHFVAQGLTHQSRTSAALNGAVLVLGSVLVMLQFLWTPMELGKSGMPSLLVSIGWALLAYGLLMSIARWPRATTAFVVAAMALGAWRVHDYRDGLLVAIAILGLLVLSYRWPFLQWVAGFASIGFAAAWASGWLYRAGEAFDDRIMFFAAVVAGALLLAVLQAAGLTSRGRSQRGWRR